MVFPGPSAQGAGDEVGEWRVERGAVLPYSLLRHWRWSGGGESTGEERLAITPLLSTPSLPASRLGEHPKLDAHRASDAAPTSTTRCSRAARYTASSRASVCRLSRPEIAGCRPCFSAIKRSPIVPRKASGNQASGQRGWNQ